MNGYHDTIERATIENTDFRKVLYTGTHLQLVLMNLEAGEELGEEMHLDNDQFFRFESGSGECIIDNNKYHVSAGDAIIVPAGSVHNVINTSIEKELKMYTIYAPPHHKDGITRSTKEKAEYNAKAFDGHTTE